MRSSARTAICSAVILAGVLTAVFSGCNRRQIVLHGAVTEDNSDPRKQSPIADVEITATSGAATSTSRSNPSGFFSLTLPRWIRRGQTVTLKFRHSDYRPLEITEPVSDKIYLARLTPLASRVQPPSNQPQSTIANVKIRYSMKTNAAVNVGSAVKTFEVVNAGNIPCMAGQPCSPDGKWKATVGSAHLDAGENNEFRNARLSCIGGPCPFTKVINDGYSKGGNKIQASVLDWSDTTTFLLEAEVYRPMDSQVVRISYPVIFGRTLNFSLPGSAEGPSVEADVDGQAIVFPLGPHLCMSWADCSESTDRDQSRTYRCQLKPGFEFR